MITNNYVELHGSILSPFLFQFDALHTRGSSHGCSRITRRAYDQPYYVSMMDEAFKLWAQIEEESGTELYMYVVILPNLASGH